MSITKEQRDRAERIDSTHAALKALEAVWFASRPLPLTAEKWGDQARLISTAVRYWFTRLGRGAVLIILNAAIGYMAHYLANTGEDMDPEREATGLERRAALHLRRAAALLMLEMEQEAEQRAGRYMDPRLWTVTPPEDWAHTAAVVTAAVAATTLVHPETGRTRAEVRLIRSLSPGPNKSRRVLVRLSSKAGRLQWRLIVLVDNDGGIVVVDSCPELYS